MTSVEVAILPERCEPIRTADYQVVRDLNLEQFTGLNQISCHFDVCFTRGRIKRGVIVCQNETGR